jgi:predicted SprT family Zn-dependent metalloprotease
MAKKVGGSEQNPNREYVTLSEAFDFFNKQLFDGALPHVLITLQRHAGSLGYYSFRMFEGRGRKNAFTDEIALNPKRFKGRSDEDILSTLLHEMAHEWQYCFGKPGRKAYHNAEWADKMESLGVMPSDTGQPGGRRTGQRMTHFIMRGGPFDVTCRKLLKNGIRLEWQSRESDELKPRESKKKYTCGNCGLNAWAKPDVLLGCINCQQEMSPA